MTGNAYVPDGEEDRIDAEGLERDRWALIDGAEMSAEEWQRVQESDEREALADNPFSGRVSAGEY